MAKRYEGNTGRVRPLEEEPLLRPAPAPPPPPEPPPPPRRQPGPTTNPLAELLPRQLKRMLSGSLRDLETEDLLLMLILYLLYRESGDAEWLLTLAALVFLS